MRFRSRLLLMMGIVLLALGIMKPLAETGYQALRDVEVFPATATAQQCREDCESKPLDWWWLKLLWKKEPKPEGVVYGYDTDEKSDGGGEPKDKFKFISLGFKHAEKGVGIEEDGGFPYFLIGFSAAAVLLLVLLIRRFRKRRGRPKDALEDEVTPPQQYRQTKVDSEETFPPLPVEQVRQQVVLFNRQLPARLKRRETESFSEWFGRIGFHPSTELQHLYEVIRYDSKQSIQVPSTALTDIKHDFSNYLNRFR
ncbi:hypothetical protein [Exiguobacterium oxidotolerans]|uniref:DUF4129 domain-containing protein n=1 Tax=Exiguobacterium oxidotolerans TaxID=223958 RepID=A0A653I8D2_9BACL|nr:hypothetical protein [Exiguobacterium oxidotolerans]VWX35307.1 conserved hypothetical protein [Exiguobacterium oxidotolerans]